jgi:hypothetical protein
MDYPCDVWTEVAQDTAFVNTFLNPVLFKNGEV